MVRLTFHGAAETVTGSKYLLEADDAKVLLDCGLFQGLKELRERNWDDRALNPSQVDAVVLTHAHIDHCGLVPRFVKKGFHGPIFCTPATEELTELMLLDSAKVQEEDAEYANRKGYAKHQPALALYETSDVKRAMKRFRTVRRGQWTQAAGPVWFRFHDTGHLLGACMVEVEIRAKQPLRLLFSGDVGRYDAPLYHDPAPPPACDHLVCESTYGDRDHPPGNAIDQLCEVVLAAIERGGVMLMAAFAVGRAQQLIYLLHVLMQQGRIPQMPIVLDSPMAVSGMNIYKFYAAEQDLAEGLAIADDYVFEPSQLELARTTEESKRTNRLHGPAVIISSSGMMTGGRILHHLKQRLPDERNTIVIPGFMAAGTRGRQLLEGARSLRIHGRDVPVRAAVVRVDAMSGHADRGELLRWLAQLPPPRRVFLTHGELPSAQSLAQRLHAEHGWDTVVPRMRESFELT